ncbi:T9SS type A sorting domain-containing protein [Fulvivirgaceae bacterium BMA10]|uniref:T9SS type A sorting domain-containing protein n=1 Tax=Splendidivirga corallicola TaxID=3051826 RepID=A0ABT8KYR4_9BACT|nr:T9SS type A sorting domain-containing protein [Fulvivirgaceae bacterium BMA10]
MRLIPKINIVFIGAILFLFSNNLYGKEIPAFNGTTVNLTENIFNDPAEIKSPKKTVNNRRLMAAPIVTTTVANLSYTEGDGAVIVDGGVTVTDDDVNLASANIQITGNFMSGEDVLAFTDQNGITGSFDSGTGILTLTGTALVAHYKTALQSITYENTSQNPSTLTRTVRFRVNDGVDDSNDATRDIDVSGDNDAPVVTTTVANLSYTEGDGAVAVDGAVTVTDVDDTDLESASVQITVNFATGEDVLAFTNQNGIVGSFNSTTGELTLTGTSSVANYQTALQSITYENTSQNPSTLTRTVRFRVNDGDTDSNDATRDIDVSGDNDAPVVTTTVANLSYTEGDGAVAVDGAVTVTDVDDTDLESASVQITVNFATGEDVLAFTNQNGIVGSFNSTTGELTLTGTSSVANYQTALQSITYENTSQNPSTLTRTVRFRVNDGDTDSNDATRDIDVSGDNDAPVVTTTVANLSYTEGDGAVAADGAVTVTDVDDTDLESASVQITVNFATGEDVLAFTNQNGIVGSFNSTTGELTLTGTSSVANYQTALQSITYENTSQNPSTLTRTVRFRVNDGDTDSNDATRDIDVSGDNDAPVVTTTVANLSYTEGDGAVLADGGVTVTDVDDTNLESANVQITTNFVSGEDVLAFTNQLGITGSFNSGTGILTLTGTSSVTNYQTALRSITYENTSENPSTLTRTVRFRVNDGDTDSNDATRDIDVSGDNDAPVVTTTVANLTYTEGDGAVIADGGVTVTDVDDTNLESASIRIIVNFVSGEDVLSFTNQNGITGSFNSTLGELTLTGTSSVANYQTALQSITYENTSENPSTLTRTVRFRVNDGNVDSNDATRDIDVNADNDAPVVTTTVSLLNYTENDGPVIIDNGVTLTDLDDTSIESASVRITSNFETAEDVLAFTNQNGITGSFNAATGELTLTGTSSIGNYQTALRSVTYENASDNPSTLTRTIRFRANDGSVDSNDATRDVSITAENDAPAITTTPTSLNYLEGSGSVQIDGGLTLTDPDSPTIQSATVSISNNHVPAEDALGFFDLLGITGSYNSGTGVLTLTGPATVTNFQTAFQTVTYTNSSANPDTSPRTITFTATDGLLTSPDASRIITINSTNSQPTLTNSGIEDVTVDEDDPNTVINLHNFFEDVEDPDEDLTYIVVSNSNAALFDSYDIVSTATTDELILDYAENQNGVATITVRATDTGGLLVESTFTVTVNAVNDQPTTTEIPDVSVDEDAPDTVIDLFATFDDVEDADNLLTYTIESNTNPGLFDNVTIDDVLGTLTLDFADNSNGVAEITVRATDTETLFVDDVFTVNVAAINDEPTLTAIVDPAPIDEDSGEQIMSLTGISAGPNEDQLIQIAATTDRPDLVTIAATTDYVSPDANYDLRYTPVENAFGTATITVFVADNGSNLAPNDSILEETFSVVINSVNDAPTIDPVDDPNTIFVNSGEQTIDLTGIGPGAGETQTLNMTVVSSNTALIPNIPANLRAEYSSPDATGTIYYTPLADATGVTTITVILQDDGPSGAPNVRQTTINFNVTVSSVNVAPTLDPINDVVVLEDADQSAVDLTNIGPGVGETQGTSVELFSDNTALFDENDGESLLLEYIDDETTGTIRIKPIANQWGMANITVRVTDDGPGDAPNVNTFERTFQITVDPINDAPFFNDIPDQPVYGVNETPDPIRVTGLNSGPNESQIMNFTFLSSNITLVNPSNITINEALDTITYTLEQGVEGETTITVIVEDGGLSDDPHVNIFQDTFKVTVSDEPDLQVSGISLSNNNVSRNQPFTMTVNFANIGNGDAAPTSLQYFLRADKDIDLNNLENETLLDTKSIPDITEAGFSGLIESPQLKIDASPGSYYVFVLVDRTDNITEIREDNNLACKEIAVNTNQIPEIVFEDGENPAEYTPSDVQFALLAKGTDIGGNLSENEVNIHYRGITSDGGYIVQEAQQKEQGNKFEYTINVADIGDDMGLEYFFSIRDPGDLVARTDTAFIYVQHPDPGLTLPGLSYGASVANYQMVSVPLKLDNGSASNVFNNEFGTYNKEKWRLFGFDAGAQSNVENSASGGGLEIVAGKAYWLIVRDDPGRAVDTGGGTVVRNNRNNPFDLSLKKGWNMIATPYPFDVSWSDVLTLNGDKALAVGENLKVYSNGAWTDSDEIEKFKGAFVWSDVDVDLEIPVIKNATVNNNNNNGGRNGGVANQDYDWKVNFSLQSGNLQNNISAIGMHQNANDSKDRYDEIALPHFDFIGYLDMNFDHPEHFASKFSSDIVPSKASHTWDFEIESNENGEVVLSWDKVDLDIHDVQLLLYDIASEKVIDMLSSTSHKIDLNGKRRFKIYYGDDNFIEENLRPESIVLGQNYPNPFTAETTIPFTLSDVHDNYDIEVSVFNTLGQRVSQIAKDSFRPGFYEISWDGKNDRGDKQPSGIYIYKLSVQSGEFKREIHGRAVLKH